MNTVIALTPEIPSEISGAATDKSVLAFVSTPELIDTIGLAIPQTIVRGGDIRSAIQALSQQETADILLVELGDIDVPEGAVNALRTVCRKDSRILALGTVNDITLYRDLIAAGADDYLIHPAGSDALARAVERLASPRGRTEDKKRAARKIFVTGATGGAGLSSFIAGAGWHLAETKGLKTAIVDLDLTFGTAALGFDIEPSHALREVLENPERVDRLFIESALAQVTANLAILGSEEDLADPAAIRPGAVELLLQELGSSHDCILIDIPLTEIVIEPRLLAAADAIVIFSEMNLTAIRDILRIRDFVSDSGFDLSPTVIAGKVPPKDKAEVSQKEFSRSLSLPVDHILPFDSGAAAAAAKNGRAVTDIAPKSPLARATAAAAEALCRDLLGNGKTGSLWQKLRRKG